MMLEHSAMYLNVTPPYEDETSFFPDFYTARWVYCVKCFILNVSGFFFLYFAQKSPVLVEVVWSRVLWIGRLPGIGILCFVLLQTEFSSISKLQIYTPSKRFVFASLRVIFHLLSDAFFFRRRRGDKKSFHLDFSVRSQFLFVFDVKFACETNKTDWN